MPNYTVTWVIDIDDADGVVDAAQQARDVQLEPNEMSSIFTVMNCETNETVDVDLFEAEINCPKCHHTIRKYK